MKKLLLCALLCAPLTYSHADDAPETIVIPKDNSTQLAWKVAIATDDVAAAKKLIAAPDFSPLMKIDSWYGTVLGLSSTYDRGEIARAIIGAAPAVAMGDSTQLLSLQNRDNWPALQFLLAQPKFDPNVRYGITKYKIPLLSECAIEGNPDGVRGLLALRKIEVNARDKDGETALHCANYATINEAIIARLLLQDKRVDPNPLNAKGQTPLHIAASAKGRVGVLEALLRDRRVKLNIKDKEGKTPLDMAVVGEPEAVELLLSSGLKPSAEQQAKIVTLYAKNQLSVPTAPQLKWLHIIVTGDTKAARIEAKKPDFDLALAMPDKTTILGLALARKNLAMTTILLDSAKNRGYLRDSSAIRQLGYQANLPILKRFLAQPDFNPNGNNDGEHILLFAVDDNNFEGVKLLLAHPRIDVNVRHFFDGNALRMANQPAMARLLLSDPRINPNQTDKLGNTMLYWLAYFGSPKVVQVLVADPRVDVNLANENGDTPLLMAASKTLVNVKVMLDSGRVKIGPQERAKIDYSKAGWGISESPIFNEAK